MGPPLLAGAYFALREYHLAVVVFGLIVRGGLVVVAIGFLFAIEEKLNELRGKWRPKPKPPNSPAPAPNPAKP